jgi:hypothetical protein
VDPAAAQSGPTAQVPKEQKRPTPQSFWQVPQLRESRLESTQRPWQQIPVVKESSAQVKPSVRPVQFALVQ